jgi:hypothetical protein
MLLTPAYKVSNGSWGEIKNSENLVSFCLKPGIYYLALDVKESLLKSYFKLFIVKEELLPSCHSEFKSFSNLESPEICKDSNFRHNYPLRCVYIQGNVTHKKVLAFTFEEDAILSFWFHAPHSSFLRVNQKIGNFTQQLLTLPGKLGEWQSISKICLRKGEYFAFVSNVLAFNISSPFQINLLTFGRTCKRNSEGLVPLHLQVLYNRSDYVRINLNVINDKPEVNHQTERYINSGNSLVIQILYPTLLVTFIP